MAPKSPPTYQAPSRAAAGVAMTAVAVASHIPKFRMLIPLASGRRTGPSPVRSSSGVTDATTLVAVKGSFIAAHHGLARDFCNSNRFCLEVLPPDYPRLLQTLGLV